MWRRHGCDMRGMLSFQLLYLLSQRPMHGEQIAQEIGKRRGEKPKAGTIYPALKELKKKNLIRGVKEGKTIVYTLTPDGKRVTVHATTYFIRSFGYIFESHRE